MPAQELWALGFNAHGQLNTSPTQPKIDHGEFKRILSSPGEIRVLRASWSQTIISSPSTGILILGHNAATYTPDSLPVPTSEIDGCIGDHSCTTHLLTATGALIPLPSARLSPPTTPAATAYRPLTHTATTSTGLTAAACPCSTHGAQIRTFATQTALHAWHTYASAVQTHTPMAHCAQLLSFATGFVVRGHQGPSATPTSTNKHMPSSVYTCGDARYPAALGRPPRQQQHGAFGPVEALGGLDVVHVAACENGWVVGAVTGAGDGFVWGGRDAGEMSWVRGLGEEGEGVVRVVLPVEGGAEEEEEEEEGREVRGLAVGVGRVVILDGEGEVWLAERSAEPGWRKVRELKGKRVVGVACGDSTAFAVVESGVGGDECG